MHTRDNKLKIYQDHVHYNLRKYFFANRVICIWNSLPDSIIEANSVDTFNNRIGSKTLFEKTLSPNDQDFFIRTMYKHSY